MDFPTYNDFAHASLNDIYGQALKTAKVFKTNQMKSGVWLNQSGKKGFKFDWQELPWEAQMAPINAMVSGDFNGDGKLELILAQNHFTNWLETGPWSGHPGAHLEWNGKKFVSLTHRESGILLPNDTKAIASCDMNGDGKLDIITASNSGPVQIFLNQVVDEKK